MGWPRGESVLSLLRASRVLIEEAAAGPQASWLDDHRGDHVPPIGRVRPWQWRPASARPVLRRAARVPARTGTIPPRWPALSPLHRLFGTATLLSEGPHTLDQATTVTDTYCSGLSRSAIATARIGLAFVQGARLAPTLVELERKLAGVAIQGSVPGGTGCRSLLSTLPRAHGTRGPVRRHGRRIGATDRTLLDAERW